MGNVRYLMSYRSNCNLLVKLATSFWVPRKFRNQLQDNRHEILTLRSKVRNMANELNEWRWKVGGIDYQVNGEQARALVENGMMNKGYPIVEIEDTDLRPIEREPQLKRKPSRK